MLGCSFQLKNWGMAAGFVAIFGGVLVCSFLWAISYSPPPSGGPRADRNYSSTSAAETPSNQDQRESKTVPLAVQIIDPPEGTPDRERLEKERHEKAENERGLTVATWVLAMATIFLFFVAIGQIVVFIFQLRYIRDTLTLTQRTTTAAEKTILTTETAYIFAGIGGSSVVSQMPTVAVTLFASAINYGQTPGMVSDIEWGLCPARLLPEIDEPLTYPNSLFVGWTIRPRGWQEAQMPIVSVFGLTETHVFYGRVKYKDIFDRGPFFSEFMHTIDTSGAMFPVQGRDAYARSRKPG